MWSTPAQLLRNPNLTPSLTSFTDFATSCSALRACATCYSLPASITIFMEDLLRPVPFDLNSSSSLRDVDVYNYTLNKGKALNVTNYSLHSCDGELYEALRRIIE